MSIGNHRHYDILMKVGGIEDWAVEHNIYSERFADFLDSLLDYQVELLYAMIFKENLKIDG